jgi:hypothetical protein
LRDGIVCEVQMLDGVHEAVGIRQVAQSAILPAAM